MKTVLSFVSVLGFVSCRNVISPKKEATGFLRTERVARNLARASNILTSNGDESYLEKLNLHATRLDLVTDEDWEKRIDNMDSTGEYKEYQIRALNECIEKCSWEDNKADFIGNAFEEQMEAFNNDGALKPKNMCLSCFEKLPEEIWKPTTTTKTTSTSTTTVTPEPTTDKIAATTNAPTTVTATTASGAFTITDDGRS